MGWATNHIAALQAGEGVSFRPVGNSMTPLIKSGDKCTLVPLDKPLEKGSVVLCKVRGKQFLHLVSAIRGDQVQISNNHGHINGWTSVRHVYGVLTKVEP